MKKTFMLLAIACALLMAVPAMASAENLLPDTAIVTTSQADAPAVNLVQIQASRSDAAVPCTCEAASTDSFGALHTYANLGTGSDSHPQRLEVAARTRSEIG